MKKIFSTLMAALLAAASALTASAGMFVYDESDGEYWDAALNMMDKEANYIWYTDGTASSHGNPKLSGDNAEMPESNLNDSLEPGWYELVLCNLGSVPEMFPEEVDGRVALIIRGTSTFTVKSENAMNAGAVAVFCGNNCRPEEMIDETGAMTGSYMDSDMNLEYDTIPIGLLSSDMTVKMVADAAGVSIAEAVEAVTAVCSGAEDLGLEYKNTIRAFYGTAAEYAAAGEPGNAEEAPSAEEEPSAEEVPAPTVEEIIGEETVEKAPQTFDFGVIAAIAALVSAAGYALSKKR